MRQFWSALDLSHVCIPVFNLGLLSFHGDKNKIMLGLFSFMLAIGELCLDEIWRQQCIVLHHVFIYFLSFPEKSMIRKLIK